MSQRGREERGGICGMISKRKKEDHHHILHLILVFKERKRKRKNLSSLSTKHNKGVIVTLRGRLRLTCPLLLFLLF